MTKTVKLAVVIDGPIHVEEDEKLKIIRHGNKCNISFLDADVETAGVFAIVKEATSLCSDSKVRTSRTREKFQNIPTSRTNGVLVVQLKTQAMMSNATDSVKLTENEMTGPTRIMKIEKMDSFRNRSGNRAKRWESLSETASASQSNKFAVLEMAESEFEVDEKNEVDVVQEINNGDEDGEVGGSAWKPDTRERRCEIGILSEKAKKCNVKVLGTDVKILLASVSAIFEEGNIVMFGQQDSHVENTSTC